MKGKTFDNYFFKTTILLISIIVFGGISTVFAQVPVLDGHLDQTYISNGYSVDYDGFYPQASATLYVVDNVAIDPDNVWLAWVVTKDFNDNSYEANKHSTWTSGHTFDDLLESDLQRLDLENSCGEIVLDATMDLLDGPPYHAAYATPSGYGVDMDSTESVKLNINGGDWSKMAFQTSLAYNLNSLGFCTAGNCSGLGTDLLVNSPPWLDDPSYTPIAAYGGWDYDLIWEVRIDRTVFATATCPGATLLGIATNPVELHASPSKIGVSPVTLFKASSTIGDYVWLDANRDGIQDIIEPGIPNVTVVLYTDPNGDGDPSEGSIVRVTTTDAFGRYAFNSLGQGNYVVEVTDDYGMLTDLTMTTGTTNPHNPIALPKNSRYLDADFGYAPGDLTKGAIGDYIWSDPDNDGMQDAGEPGIGGVTVNLLTDIDGDGNFTDVVATTTTEDDGYYMFVDLDPGQYVVDVTDTANKLTGYTLTIGPQSANDPTEVILLDAGEVYLNADFGYYNPNLGSIGNQIWFDEDGDGLFEPGDGEIGLGSVSVNLIKDADGDGVWDPGERVISTVTSVDGSYLFQGLSLDDGDGDADYLAIVTDTNDILRRYRLSFGPTPGADNNSQSNPYPVALSAASPDNLTADFGYFFDRENGIIGDRVWYDLDGDGNQDPGEPGIGGVTIELWTMKNGSEDRLLGYITTDANGNYYFPNLDVSRKGLEYRAKVVDDYANDTSSPLYGYTLTNLANDWDDSDPLTSTNLVDLTLDFGYRLDAGVNPTYSIGDYVWHDADGEGDQDVFEDGFENVTLALYQDRDGDGIIDVGSDPMIAYTATDASGNYIFNDLVNGDYIVQITDDHNILTGYQKTYGTLPWPVTINNADDFTIDFGFFRESPTLAFVAPFQVYSDGGRMVVQWQTTSESGTAGFILLKKNPATGKFIKISDDFLPGLLHAPQGGTYRFVDNSAGYGETLTYKLIEIETSGMHREHGPFTVRVGQKGLHDNQLQLAPLHSNYSKQAHNISPAQTNRLLEARRSRELSRLQAKVAKSGTVKIAVKESGMYILSAQEIVDMSGMSLGKVRSAIKNRRIILQNQGKPVHWLADYGNMGIIFYGHKIDSIYTDQNIYVFSLGKGSVMEFTGGGHPSPANPDNTFNESLHLEIDRYAITGLFDNPEADFWLWDYISAGNGSKTFPIEVNGAADFGPGNLVVRLKGATNTPAPLDHHVKVSLNGTYLGESQWAGTEEHLFSLPFDQSILEEGANSIELEGLLDDASYSIFYLDSFDIQYNRYYRAVKDRLFCRGDGNSVITIEGFSNPEISVFDVTSPQEPKMLTGTTLDGVGGVSFVPEAPEHTYLAVTRSGLGTPVSTILDIPSKLKRKAGTAQYIIIAGEGLERAADELANLRRGQGMDTLVVEVTDIYDEFNHGIQSPMAIKEFISYTYHNGNKELKYVVLAGDGTYDYKNAQGFGDNLVPPLLKSTPFGLFAADSQYGDVMGNDGIPEVAVGRIPALTGQELRKVINKLADYRDASGPWTGKAIMVSDNGDEGGDFPADSDYLAGLLNGYSVNKIYLPQFTTTDLARADLMNSINEGAGLVNYIGHAGLNYLAGEKLFRMLDVDSLQNQERLPIFTAMTCVVGRFEIPGFQTLSEALLLKENGGAAAVWAPTGSSLNAMARVMAGELFKSGFQGLAKTLGEALMEALDNYSSGSGDRFMMDIFTLLGDPAMEIK